MNRKLILTSFLIVLFSACSTLKYVPEDEYLLDKVVIETDKGFPLKSDIKNYLHQEPNERFLGLINMNLFWYNLSGPDTTKWINRTLRNIGDAPVLYDNSQTERSRRSMQRFLVSRGYFNGRVDTSLLVKDRKVQVKYKIVGNTPYTIREYGIVANEDTVSNLITNSMESSLIKPGMPLSSEDIDLERERITRMLQEKGYYAMNKNYFSFVVDSTIGNNQAKINLVVRPFLSDTAAYASDTAVQTGDKHPVYHVGKVYFMLDVPMSSFTQNLSIRSRGQDSSNVAFDVADYDTIQNNEFFAVYRGEPFISLNALVQNCRIVPGELYDINTVEKTYARMNSLQIMKYVNIRFFEQESGEGNERNLDCYIVLTPSLKQSFSAEVEGTNTAGDLGVAGNLAFTHRNMFHGAEMLEAKFLGAYEALSTSYYTELGGELALTFPDFKFPLLNNEFKRKVNASTEFAFSYQNMTRPEFQRTVASTSLRYNWTSNTLRQTLDLINISYVYMPWVRSDFKDRYLNDSSYLKYSYEDHFILKTAYSFSYSSAPVGSSNKTYYTWRGNIESAGNSLYALYSLAGIKKDGDYYKIINVGFAQYLKGEIEYARSVVMDSRSRFAYRFGLGVAYPYGNSKILPFEQRFFSGGANSVRGWSVRTLGPGSYASKSHGIDFMNQSGDIKLDVGAEYRTNLFWKLQSALFADAGNIWTIRDYEDQPGGQFKLSNFYEQLAGSVGFGLRLDLGFFLFRMDLGMKVYDPSLVGDKKWRIKSIDNTDDFALHIAIGYPF